MVRLLTHLTYLSVLPVFIIPHMVPHILSLAPVYICSLAGQPRIRFSIITNTPTVDVGTNKARAIPNTPPLPMWVNTIIVIRCSLACQSRHTQQCMWTQLWSHIQYPPNPPMWANTMIESFPMPPSPVNLNDRMMEPYPMLPSPVNVSLKKLEP